MAVDEEVMRHYIFNIIMPGFNQTLVMFVAILAISIVLGTIGAVVLFNSSEVGLKPNKLVNGILGGIVNTIYPLPITVLMILLIPITKTLLGKSTGIVPAIFYISIACFPYIARILEGSLREVDSSVIAMGRSIGASDSQILWRLVLHEAVPSMVLGVTFFAILLVGYISVAGIVGGGGIGEVALTYGYRRYNHFIMNSCVIVMVVFAGVVQLVGNLLYRLVK